MGNPSDGFNGKTIAMSISNFWAEVTLVESQTLVNTHTQVHTHTHRCIFFFFTTKSAASLFDRFWSLIHSTTPRSSGACRICSASAEKKGAWGHRCSVRSHEWDVCVLFALMYCLLPFKRYLGGLRLLQATCKKFYQFCSKQGWDKGGWWHREASPWDVCS